MSTIEIEEIARKFPDLLERILAKSTGALGEILVADALNDLGYSVKPTNNNAQQCDLIVTSPSGFVFGVEVKTGRERRPTWFVGRCPDPSFSAIWCMVSAPRAATELPRQEDVEIYVLTTDEARKIWQSSSYNEREGAAPDIRRNQVSDDSLRAWHKLPK